MDKKNEKPKYDVFISYSRKDYVDKNKNIIPNNDISRIKEALTNAGISYWFDEECINYGKDFINKVVNNIKSSKIFIFLSTENANKSKWTRKEIGCADEFKKNIIPVRIDATRYDERIMFRISDLNYIEYYIDPAKALVDLVDTVNKHLEEIEEKEKRELEEEERKKEIEREKTEKLRQQKEEEERRRKEEEQQFFVRMQKKCMTLNKVESRLELGREELLAEIGLINDATQREELREKIINGGPIHKKYHQECRELAEKSNELEQLTKTLTEEKNDLYSQIETKNKECRELAEKSNELERLSKTLTEEKNDLYSQIEEKKRTSWSINKRVSMIICIALFMAGLFCGIIVGGRSQKMFEIKYISTLEDSVSVYKGKLNSDTKLHSSDSLKFVLANDTILIYKNSLQQGISISKVVDLGLSVKWAGWNVGASSPEEYGDYYAWGETSTKNDYSWETYKWCNGTEDSMTKYCTDSDYGTVDNKITLEPDDDVARVKWGGSWRMPTHAEQKELHEKCEWKWTTYKGVNGYKVTGPNGNSIFLPAAGYRDGAEVRNRGSYGYYWSSSLKYSHSRYVNLLYFNSSRYVWGNYYCCYGRTVRPVYDSHKK